MPCAACFCLAAGPYSPRASSWSKMAPPSLAAPLLEAAAGGWTLHGWASCPATAPIAGPRRGPAWRSVGRWSSPACTAAAGAPPWSSSRPRTSAGARRTRTSCSRRSTSPWWRTSEACSGYRRSWATSPSCGSWSSAAGGCPPRRPPPPASSRASARTGSSSCARAWTWRRRSPRRAPWRPSGPRPSSTTRATTPWRRAWSTA
mmetsp:Transcript_118786/g.369116  ORF Transcript_118786/g.369116 Transcript_118786/m.369116 type:complete len:203 (+) Transcript_118786:265-873(+)